jgi:hypothetical protein
VNMHNTKSYDVIKCQLNSIVYYCRRIINKAGRGDYSWSKETTAIRCSIDTIKLNRVGLSEGCIDDGVLSELASVLHDHNPDRRLAGIEVCLNKLDENIIDSQVAYFDCWGYCE